MPSSAACDRCYSLKSRCLPGPEGNCYRCYRLHQLCTFSRQRGKRGPKPKIFKGHPSQSTHEHGLLSASVTTPRDLSNVAPRQENDDAADESMQEPPRTMISRHESLHIRVSEDTALSICTFFSFGPQLSMDMYRTLKARVAEAPLLLLSPYGAVTRVFLRCSSNQTPCSDTDWSNCASALQTLRNASITKVEHVGSFLSLGLSLVTFHRLISGISASTICRFTLLLIRPFYYSGQLADPDPMGLLCLIFLDTTQSLFRARVPIIEYRVRDPFLVDPHAGLCGPLLPLLYRVCLLGAAIRTGDSHISPECFDNLRKELDNWSPNISHAVLGRLSEEENLLLIMQANLHRVGALLFLHRLRYPFGERDDEAQDLSRSIINDMEHCLAVTGHHPPNITLVLLVAGAELLDGSGRQEIQSLISRILGSNFYPFIPNLRLFLRRVWAGRDQGTARYLFHLFDEDPELSIPL
ncbi:GAL4 [Aspergillus sclerotialis]|uniref:GAL4 n=1 Tax=Aspergillus sclerotialis TaxID=2070753 RepID=A0A3A2ZJ34_9EURO|nr:GAL4 [Aspergillus sclerotialis]